MIQFHYLSDLTGVHTRRFVLLLFAGGIDCQRPANREIIDALRFDFAQQKLLQGRQFRSWLILQINLEHNSIKLVFIQTHKDSSLIE